MAGLQEVVSALVYGAIQGSLFGAVSLGLSLIWGVMKVINLAHGELVVLGAYLAVLLAKAYGVDPLLALLLDFALGAILGLVMFYAILYRLIGKVDVMTLKEEMATLLAMFWLSIFLYKFFFIWTESSPSLSLYETMPRTGLLAGASAVSIAGVSVEAAKLFVLAVSILLAVAMHFFLSKTMLGLAIRAVAQDATAVALVGMDPVRVKVLATVVGIGLTLLGGGLVALYHGTGISPELVHIYAPLSFVIVVLGTPGHLWGTMIAGIVIGEVYNLVYALTGSLSLGFAAAFAILVAVLVLRPEGLFAKR